MPTVSNRHRPTDAILDAPWFFAWPWVVGMDDDVVIDLAPQLAAGETITAPASTLWLLSDSAPFETAADATLLVGAPRVVGTTVAQRLSGLAAGALYRWTVIHGAAGNRRAAGVLIEVAP